VTRRLTRNEVLQLAGAELRRVRRARSCRQAQRALARLFLALTCSTTEDRDELSRLRKS